LDEDLDQAETLLIDNIADLNALADSVESRPHAVTTSEFLVTQQSVACQLAICQNNLATVLGRKGRRDQALRVVREAIAKLDSWVAQRPTDVDAQEHLAVANNNLGQLLWLKAADQSDAL